MGRTAAAMARLKRRWPGGWLGWVLLLALVAGAAWLVFGRGGSGASGVLTGVVDKGAVRREVSATGTLEAVVTVQVGSQVTGVISSLGADYNSVVAAGQVIARIDPSTFQAQLERAEADLEAARAQVRSAEAAVANQQASAAAVQANLEGARASRVEREAAARRSRELAEARLLSSSTLEESEAAAAEAAARERALAAQVEQSRAQMASARAGLEEARARVLQAEAAVRVARVNLDHTIIASPIDGVVVSRSVDVGQTVAASLQAPTLFVIANDLRQMHVIASIDEADIGAITEATAATFTVDAFPGEGFSGRIRQVRLEPRTSQNVVTYAVIIQVDNADLKLRPGMTANVTMTVAEAEDVLRLPNAALRFWPEDVPRERLGELLRGGAGGRAEGASAAVAAAAEAGERRDGRSAAAGERRPSAERRAEDGGGTRDGARASGRGDGGRDGQGQAPRPSGAMAVTAGGEIRFPEPPAATPRPRLVWVQAAGGKIEPRRVLVGITDGSVSAVLGGDVKEGERVVIGKMVANGGGAGRGASNPFSPVPMRGGGGGRR